jgi:hypothetical protein
MNKIIRHMTHISNLPNILQQGGLWCDIKAQQREVTKQEIGHTNIKIRRSKKPVLSPMLYSNHKNNVAGYQGGQDGILYFVTNTETIRQSGRAFFFTNGHAVVEITEQYTDLDDLDNLDWTMIRANYWKNTDEDGDRERRKQAEFLVHDFVPWSLIRGIAVRTQNVAEQVEALLEGQLHHPPVEVKSAWYY